MRTYLQQVFVSNYAFRLFSFLCIPVVILIPLCLITILLIMCFLVMGFHGVYSMSYMLVLCYGVPTCIA